MPVTRPAPGVSHGPQPIPNPAPGSNGAWVHGQDGNWAWTPGATPDATAVSSWGYGSMTDIRQDPTGVRNHGAWTPVRGGGWQWTWGANPNPSLVGTYGADKLANPDRTPNGANTKAMNTPPPPDVRPPNVTDAWKGVAPDITGKLPGSEGTSNGQLTEPPAHPAFMVEPGTIRDAESFLLTVIDDQIAKYNNLKAYVAESHGQNLYNHGAGYEAITVPQHRLLLGIGDAIELAGQYTQMLNIAAQSYAKADINSFLPGT